MIQVKMFDSFKSTEDDPDLLQGSVEMEAEANKWLTENVNNIKVVDIKLSQSSVCNGSVLTFPVFTLMIIYDTL